MSKLLTRFLYMFLSLYLSCFVGQCLSDNACASCKNKKLRNCEVDSKYRKQWRPEGIGKWR